MTTEQDEFWGDEAGWSTSPSRDHATEHQLVSDASDGRGIGSKASRLWGSLLTSGSKANRAHGGADSASDYQIEADSSPNSANEPDDAIEEWDEGWEVEPVPTSNGGVDPLLAKFGGAAVVLTLLIPVAIGFRSGSDEQLIEAAAAVSAVTLNEQDDPVEPEVTTAATAAAAGGTQISTNSPASDDVPTSLSEAEIVGGAAPTNATRSVSELEGDQDVSGSSAGNIETAATVDAPAERVERCPIEYEVVVGDFWIRIADGAGVSTSELLALNGASSGTPLYPGSSICLPAGSSNPPPPPSPSPATPAATSPATTAAPTTAAPTTAAPTTAPPTTAKPAPIAPAEIEAIIRYVWPDELEEHALEIAWRESNYVPTAKNYCCYGLFQIYWDVHRSWLGDVGVTSATQLYDPAVNARAAYALYERAGGFGPWGG